MEQDFDKIHAQLYPSLKQLEKQRLELKAKGNRNGMIFGVNHLSCRIIHQPVRRNRVDRHRHLTNDCNLYLV